MFALRTLLQAILVRFILGESYCLSNDKPKRVYCVPCSELCPTENRSCIATYSFCPKQCGKECTSVCDDNCLDGRCEYIYETTRLKCIGCKPEFTGQTCQELCASNCLECDQYNATMCTKCTGNNQLPDCKDMHESSTLPFTFSTMGVNRNNCSSNCLSCNPDPTSRDCIECPPGKYGRRCENVCTHCNKSLCEKENNCLECIGNLSSSECGTELTNNATTSSSMANCADADCLQTTSESSVLVITGVSIAVFLAISLVCICYQFNVRYRLKCVLEVREQHSHCGNKDPRSDGSLATYHGYAYINDRDTDQDRNDLRPAPCQGDNLYESVGNRDVLRESDMESMSSVFTLTGSVLRNLFEIRNERYDNNDRNVAEINPNQSCEDGYEMRYLTPTTCS